MRFWGIKSSRGFALALFCVTLLVFASDVVAQQQRRSRRRTRRRPVPARVVTAPQPAVQQPSAPLRDAEVVGSTENFANQENAASGTPNEGASTATVEATEPLQRTLEKLSSQVAELTKKINQLEGQNDVSADFERLQRAEQRGEALQVQLRQLQDKEINLRARSDQLDYEMRPESLMRRTELIGSINPETMRQQFRQQLEREKQLVTTQLEQLAASRARLDSAIASSDAYVERLRKRIEAEERPPVAIDEEAEAASQALPDLAPTQPENLP